MIVLDTNVISEAMKPKPDPLVMTWLDRQTVETIYMASVTFAELLLGIERLPAGRRKDTLTETLRVLVQRLFGERVLAFDREAAEAYATLAAKAQRSGYSIQIADAQIGAVAYCKGFRVATRDTTPFLAAGIRVVNPWQDA